MYTCTYVLDNDCSGFVNLTFWSCLHYIISFGSTTLMDSTQPCDNRRDAVWRLALPTTRVTTHSIHVLTWMCSSSKQRPTLLVAFDRSMCRQINGRPSIFSSDYDSWVLSLCRTHAHYSTWHCGTDGVRAITWRSRWSSSSWKWNTKLLTWWNRNERSLNHSIDFWVPPMCVGQWSSSFECTRSTCSAIV